MSNSDHSDRSSSSETSDDDEENSTGDDSQDEENGQRTESPAAPKKPRRGRTANHPVWEYFTQNPEKKNSRCNVCKVTLNTLKSSNVETHLRTKHSKEFSKYDGKLKKFRSMSKKSKAVNANLKPQTLFEAFSKTNESSNPYPKGSSRYEEITDTLAMFIATSSASLNVVNNKYFCALLDKRYRPPDRRELPDRIRKLAVEVRLNIQAKINDSGKITVCSDIWSRPGLTESFLGISAHFYARSTHKRFGVLLGLPIFPSPHTGDRIKSLIDDCLKEWDISENKVIRYVTDSGSNMVKAMRDAAFTYFLKDIEDKNGEIIDPNLDFEDDDDSDEEIEQEPVVIKKHMRCFVHFLMCALRCTVDKDKDFITFRKSIFSIIKKISKSCVLQERLKTLSGLKLVVVSKTRWNSTYQVFERLLRLTESIDIIAKEQKWDPLPWRTLEMYANFLKPFADQTNFLQGTNYPTLSSVMTALIELMDHLENKMKEDKINYLAMVVKNEMDRRFGYIMDVNRGDFDPTYVTACFLDPTVALSLDDGQIAAAKVLLMQMSSNGDVSGLHPPSQETTSSNLSPAVFQRIERRRLNATVSVSNSLQAEISAYWTGLETGNAIIDCIKFWLSEKDHYKRLYDIAIDLLGIPATSAPLEGFFSQASAVLDGRRYRLNAKSLEAELFLRINANVD